MLLLVQEVRRARRPIATRDGDLHKPCVVEITVLRVVRKAKQLARVLCRYRAILRHREEGAQNLVFSQRHVPVQSECHGVQLLREVGNAADELQPPCVAHPTSLLQVPAAPSLRFVALLPRIVHHRVPFGGGVHISVFPVLIGCCGDLVARPSLDGKCRWIPGLVCMHEEALRWDVCVRCRFGLLASGHRDISILPLARTCARVGDALLQPGQAHQLRVVAEDVWLRRQSVEVSRKGWRADGVGRRRRDAIRQPVGINSKRQVWQAAWIRHRSRKRRLLQGRPWEEPSQDPEAAKVATSPSSHRTHCRMPLPFTGKHRRCENDPARLCPFFLAFVPPLALAS
eukprot:scaffold642_cov232-Pinguiococcus_pyrenoidosus.AAC.16